MSSQKTPPKMTHKMTPKQPIERLSSGVPNLDALFWGGIPVGSSIVVGGAPGSGKSTLVQQICFHNASPTRTVLYFNTLSEPAAKTLQHLNQFQFFQPDKLNSQVNIIDIGSVLRSGSLEGAARQIMEHVKDIKPAIVVIDSFKAFDDIASSRAEQRKFSYELAVNLMAWQATTFLLGEYSPQDIATSPLFSIVDGLVMMSQREAEGELQRYLQIVKMRATGHRRDPFPFEISDAGIEIYAPRLTLQRAASAESAPTRRMRTGISKLDDLLGPGIPLGSSILVGGVAGTGKTVLLLEFLYRGALAGEKGILFSFEETEERLRSAATGLGWDFNRLMESGLIEIVFIPQPDIAVEKDLFMIQKKIQESRVQRLAMDSVSVFLHKLENPEISREKIFQIATIVQNARAVGMLATDIPYGSNKISRFGVEETVVDGVILLSSTEEEFERQRYIEVYKMRNTAHLKGRHNMTISEGGIQIYPRYFAADVNLPPPALDPDKRLSIGVASLDPLLGGGLLGRSVTLVSGSPGIGKSTLGIQFLLEGVRHREKGLLVSLEESPEQIIAGAEKLRLPIEKAVKKGLLEVMYLSRHSLRANQFLSVLGEKIANHGTKRVVLDGVAHIADDLQPEAQRDLLFALAAQFKSLDVTSLLTLEAQSLHASDFVTEQALSPLADNLIMLRYERAPRPYQPFITVIKSRGSAHTTGAYDFSVGVGGVRIGQQTPLEDIDHMHEPSVPEVRQEHRPEP